MEQHKRRVGIEAGATQQIRHRRPRLVGNRHHQPPVTRRKAQLLDQPQIALDLMHPPPKCLTPGQRLLDALPLVLQSELRNVPVVNNHKERRLVGALSRAEALNRLSEAIQARNPANQAT